MRPLDQPSGECLRIQIVGLDQGLGEQRRLRKIVVPREVPLFGADLGYAPGEAPPDRVCRFALDRYTERVPRRQAEHHSSEPVPETIWALVDRYRADDVFERRRVRGATQIVPPPGCQGRSSTPIDYASSLALSEQRCPERSPQSSRSMNLLATSRPVCCCCFRCWPAWRSSSCLDVPQSVSRSGVSSHQLEISVVVTSKWN